MTTQRFRTLLPASGVAEDGSAWAGMVEWAYDTTRPLEVALTRIEEGVSVTWRVSRDLLADGRYAPAGTGDIHVFPDVEGGYITVSLLLHVDGEPPVHSEITCPRMFVEAFVIATIGMCPRGAERVEVRDEDLQALLEGRRPV